MAFDAKVLRVLIASPGDVEGERKEVQNVLRRWNFDHAETKGVVLLPLGWETEGHSFYDPAAMGPQDILNKQIVQKADIVVGIFYSRLGTSTDKFASGTVEEIEHSATDGKPVAVYFSSAGLPSNVDTAQLNALRKYKLKLRSHSVTFDFKELSGFREKLRDDLTPLVDKAIRRLDEMNNRALSSGGGKTATRNRVNNDYTPDRIETNSKPQLVIDYRLVIDSHDSENFIIKVIIGIKNTNSYVATYPSIQVKTDGQYNIPISQWDNETTVGWRLLLVDQSDMRFNSISESFIWTGGLNESIHPQTSYPILQLSRKFEDIQFASDESLVFGDSLPMEYNESGDIEFAPDNCLDLNTPCLGMSYELCAEGCQPVIGTLVITYADICKVVAESELWWFTKS